jgi:hypothetical protein
MAKQEVNKAIVGRWFTNFWGKTCKLGIVDELAAPGMLSDPGPGFTGRRSHPLSEAVSSNDTSMEERLFDSMHASTRAVTKVAWVRRGDPARDKRCQPRRGTTRRRRSARGARQDKHRSRLPQSRPTSVQSG